jgi:hypothetical protein
VVNQKESPAARGAGMGVPLRTERYDGHEVVYPLDERRASIFIDGRPVRWGKAGNTYYLEVYAYDRGASLEETVKRYIAYLGPRRDEKGAQQS